jgi:hypothetical protein
MHMAAAFTTPEDAAMDGFPSKYCRVVASRVDHDDAYVLLDTGSDGRSYLYGVNCRRQDGLWHELSSSNGCGWSPSESDPLRGTMVYWDEAPADADSVRIEFDGRIWEEPVRDRAFLAVWWNVTSPQSGWPQLVAARVKGEWR